MAPPIEALLDRAAAAGRRRALAWLISGTVVAAASAAVGWLGAAFVVGLTGVSISLSGVRDLMGHAIARRDVARADSPPRRGYLTLLDDPNPRAYRPLLIVWPGAPEPGAGPPSPESVWRADCDLDDLDCSLGHVTVHEAWIDTGRKPRWVLADAGVSVPHRRSVLGRWYVRRVLRTERLAPPVPLTRGAPSPAVGPVVALPDEGRLTSSVVARVVGFAVFAGLLELLAEARG